ncbi:hypothetical protein AWZ03_008658 [Drosophila navojoa]|uniref:Uncharacterized protein n=1 Tax=Drosophila navojoa TaxID=7232 RepID=A0A484B7R5_DRONA|nr:hypothetical protein AWZ03_008658 [Drosophila navojoa]
MLLDIAARINRKTFKLYRTSKTDWLVADGEQIGVQTKYKEELGMEMESFFRPSYPGAPQPSAVSPAVVESRLTPNYASSPHSSMNTSTFRHIGEQPKTGEFKKRNLDNLLNAEQVQLIDSKEVIERIQNFVKKVKDRRKVCKSIERTRSPLQGRKLSPQEVLRSCNRPKRKVNIFADHKKQSFRPDDAEPTALQKPRQIVYNHEQTLLSALSRRENAAEMGQLKMHLKSKTNQNNTKINRAERQAERINKKKLENASNVWKSAVSIKLDKMNKKLPVANSKWKSYEDPDRTPRPYTADNKDFRPKIRDPKVNESRTKLNAIKKEPIENRKHIKDKGKQQHYIKIEKIKQVKVNDWLEDTEMDTETDEQQRPDITNQKLKTAKKPEKSKEKVKKSIEKKTEVEDKCKKQQQSEVKITKKETNGEKEDSLEDDSEEAEQEYLLGTEDEELMNEEVMESKDSSASPKKQRAFTKLKMLIMKMKNIVIKSNRAVQVMSRMKMQVKEGNQLVEDSAMRPVGRSADVVRTVEIHKPQKRTAVVNAISPRSRVADHSEPPTAEMPMSVQVYEERNVLQELPSLVEATSRGRDKSRQNCELCKNESKSKIWNSLGIRFGNYAKRTKLFPANGAKSSKKEPGL